MSDIARQDAPARDWQSKATLVVYLLAAAAFLYLGWAWHTQRAFKALMTDLLSSEASRSEAAGKRLAATDDALPYLTDALLNRPVPEDRVLAAKTILSRLHARQTRSMPAAANVLDAGSLSAGLNLEAITRALSDESPDVRAAALAVIDLAGTHANYQRNRLEEMRRFEGLLGDLAAPDESRRAAAVEAFRAAGEHGLPYLVGAAFSADPDARRRGLAAARASVTEVLRSSNQRRIVALLGRRRCRVLLAGLPRLDKGDRALVTDILNVSGRIPAEFFDDFLKAWPGLDASARGKLLFERIEWLEQAERIKGVEPDLDKAQRLHDKTR